MRITASLTCAALAIAFNLAVSPVAAQSFTPTKPIRVIIPVPVGSAPDMLSRIIGAGFQAKWGQPAVVDPKPGASQNIAAEALFRADPDGYTLLTAPPPEIGRAHV